MKEYVKPTIELIELRPEERLAGCKTKIVNSNATIKFFKNFLGFGSKCKIVWKHSSHNS